MTRRPANEKRILLTRQLPDIAARLLKQEGFLVTEWPHDRPMTPDELLQGAKNSHAILCVLADRIDQHFLNACAHLELISQFGAGFDNVDLPVATQLRIPVGFTPNATSQATADVAFGLMIMVSRKMIFHHHRILSGEWKHFRPTAHLGFELKGKTLGIFGLGRIGLEMARRCKGAYQMGVLYCNRRPNPEAEKEVGAQRVSFDELLQRSDIVSVHCALTPETKGLFDRQAFTRMKPTALFINTARGLVHNEADLQEALEKGVIWGAGLDVTHPEPMRPDHPLLKMETVAILPHIGSATMEARNEMARLAAENIIAMYRTGKVTHIANPEVQR